MTILSIVTGNVGHLGGGPQGQGGAFSEVNAPFHPIPLPQHPPPLLPNCNRSNHQQIAEYPPPSILAALRTSSKGISEEVTGA